MAWCAASATSCSRRLLKNGSGLTTSAPARISRRVAKAASISLSVPALSMRSCSALMCAASGHDHGDLAVNEVDGQFRQPIIETLRPAVFNRQILSLDVAGFAQSLAEGGHKRRKRAWRNAAKEADDRHRRLLRTQRAWGRHPAAQ